jgi:hypothetical protein
VGVGAKGKNCSAQKNNESWSYIATLPDPFLRGKNEKKLILSLYLILALKEGSEGVAM